MDVKVMGLNGFIKTKCDLDW